MILTADSVTKRFGGLVAVAGVSFAVREGEIVGLIGPNGAGKTTLLNLVSGLIPVSSGRFLFDGQHDITRMPPYKIASLGVARTFQTVKPLKSMTVRQNVALGAMFGRRESLALGMALELADEVLITVGLQRKRNDRTMQLTLADMKRLELARGLAMSPKLLLLDEVMAGLNIAEVSAMMELVRRIRDTGTTVIMIEHVMKAIMGISDRVIVLHHGELIASGRPEDIVNEPVVIEAYLGERYHRDRMRVDR